MTATQYKDILIQLTKPRITLMVMVTAALGFFMGGMGIHSYPLLGIMLLGTALSASGSAVLNQYLERDVDSRMQRTCKRPLVTGAISPEAALSLGFSLVLSGVCILWLWVDLLTAFLALLTAFLYVVIYTPMKRISWLNTSFGAIPGALPPVGGWTAATGELDWGAGALFLILFAWQHPHFYAIAWLFRDDYQRGGFKMLPVVDEDGRRTCRHIVGFSVILIWVSALPTLLGLSGWLYLTGAVILGLGMGATGVRLAMTHSHVDARRLLRASIIYLPLLLVLATLDVGF